MEPTGRSPWAWKHAGMGHVVGSGVIGMFSAIRLTREQIESMQRHATEALPEECCGILLGRHEGELLIVEEVRCTRNVAETDRARRYELDPREHLEVQREARQRGLNAIGFYHSHPTGSAEPSAHDLDLAWPGCCYVILARNLPDCALTAWRFDESEGQFVRIRIIDANE